MRIGILAAAVAAAGAPLLPDRAAPLPAAVAWPATYDGRPLARIAPTALDWRLARDFPGSIARFSDGRRQVVLRQVPQATRQLHPARDCFGAIGYAITAVPMVRAPDGALASCFEARRDGVTLKVCERVTDRAGTSFPDISSWYWPALLDRSPGPWLAATTVERVG
ncbi:MAG: hypothetical protein V4537_13790 [Pseudomonadota bacterium]